MLLALGALWGGFWPVLGLLSMTALVFWLDRLQTPIRPNIQGKSGLWVSVLQACAHTTLWCLTLWSIARPDHLNWANTVVMIAGAGLYFGQISNSNAHELIHNSNRLPRRLGIAIYCSVLFGHHTSAHMRVHHVHAATLDDPNTARFGEGFWRFFLRAWPQSYQAGKQAEDVLRAKQRSDGIRSWHPYVWYNAGALAAGLGAWALGGFSGLIALFLIAFYAQFQLYLSDYVQHYGLLRHTKANGRREPMGPQHSWNAPQWYSGAMMLNAPRHSDHHAHPSRAFPDLRLQGDTMPILPHALPTMAVLALLPPIWHRVMDGRVMDRMRTNAP